MRLRAIELANTGRFTDTVRLGPFAPGLNIFAAPNESGKTTALNAAARALFDRHTTRGEEMLALRPAGTDLTPKIAVEFETREGIFRIGKVFLNTSAKIPGSLLHRWQEDATGAGSWQLLAEGDAADTRVRELLRSSLAGRGITKPEHWGLFAYLWARQGEPAAWPSFDNPAAAADNNAAQRIRAHLARVELDPVIEKLSARLDDIAGALITSAGKPRSGGELDTAAQTLAAIDAELAGLRQKNAELEAARIRHQQAADAVSQLEKEHAESETRAAALRAQAAAAERLRAELDARRQALASAQEKLATLDADTGALARLRAETAATREKLSAAETASASAAETLSNTRAQIDALAAERPRQDAALAAARAAVQRIQSILKLRRHAAAAAALARQLARVETLAADLAALDAEKQKLPALTPAKLRKLEELDETIRGNRAQLQALGLTIELTPDRDTAITIDAAAASEKLPAGKAKRLQSPSALDLALEGWGRVAIRSGSQEAQGAAADLAKAESDFAAALEASAVPSLAVARDAIAARKELDVRQKTAATALKTQLGDCASPDELRAAAAADARRAAALAEPLAPTAEEQARATSDFEADDAQIAETISAGEKTLRELDARLDALREAERAATKNAAAAGDALNEHRARLRTLETQSADLAARYESGGGIDAAKTAAQIAFAQAEARVVATKADLPPDYEKLPERNKRAAAALQQIANELQNRRAGRDQAQGTLETLGSQGLYSRESELEEKRADVARRLESARLQAWSARLAHDLIRHRRQAATRAVLKPLEDRLASAFAELTGDAARRVFLDERLQIAGLGRVREEAYPFENLSQGAKEQLLLCLRIAVAQELSAEEPQLLILDDVLVNTDPVRQERILDLLQSLSANLQILILTCHADRYRGIGGQLKLG